MCGCLGCLDQIYKRTVVYVKPDLQDRLPKVCNMPRIDRKFSSGPELSDSHRRT